AMAQLWRVGMILRAVNAVGALALVTLAVSPARADVLEIGADGAAQWISGPRALEVVPEGSAADAVSPSEIPTEAAFVPDYAIADTARHARAVPQTYAAKVAE